MKISASIYSTSRSFYSIVAFLLLLCFSKVDAQVTTRLRYYNDSGLFVKEIFRKNGSTTFIEHEYDSKRILRKTVATDSATKKVSTIGTYSDAIINGNSYYVYTLSTTARSRKPAPTSISYKRYGESGLLLCDSIKILLSDRLEWTTFYYEDTCLVKAITHSSDHVSEVTKEYKHDSMGRRISYTMITQPSAYFSGSNHLIKYQYDSLDHLTSETEYTMSDSGQYELWGITVLYEYSNEGWMIKKTNTEKGHYIPGYVEYTYDDKGRVIKMSIH